MARNYWNKFLHQQRGNGLNIKELRAMYRSFQNRLDELSVFAIAGILQQTNDLAVQTSEREKYRHATTSTSRLIKWHFYAARKLNQ